MNTKTVEQAIYKPGARHIHSFVENGLVAYSGEYSYENGTITIGPNLTLDEYLTREGEKLTGYVVLPFDEVLRQITEAEDAHYIKPWREITEEEWQYALNVLPPQKWRTVRGVQLFRMCEYDTSNITGHYAELGGRYFTANRRTSADYEVLAAEVFEASKAGGAL